MAGFNGVSFKDIFELPMSSDFVIEKLSDIVGDSVDAGVYVVMNKEGKLGAFTLFNPKVLEKLLEIFGDRFYIIPSSIHEVLIAPFESADVEGIFETIKMVNDNEFPGHETDILSYDLYSFDVNEGFKIIRREEE